MCWFYFCDWLRRQWANFLCKTVWAWHGLNVLCIYNIFIRSDTSVRVLKSLLSWQLRWEFISIINSPSTRCRFFLIVRIRRLSWTMSRNIKPNRGVLFRRNRIHVGLICFRLFLGIVWSLVSFFTLRNDVL